MKLNRGILTIQIAVRLPVNLAEAVRKAAWEDAQGPGAVSLSGFVQRWMLETVVERLKAQGRYPPTADVYLDPAPRSPHTGRRSQEDWKRRAEDAEARVVRQEQAERDRNSGETDRERAQRMRRQASVDEPVTEEPFDQEPAPGSDVEIEITDDLDNPDGDII